MLSPKEITRKWEETARTKAAMPAGRCFLLAILAGLYIALGAIGCTIVQSAVEGGLGRLLGACVFPGGLMLVVMAGGELFTGNCLMAGPLVSGKVGPGGVLRNWGIVYLGNMLGALMAALLVQYGGVLTGAAGEAALAIAEKKCALPFGEALLRGVGCNILVCGAVWMASGAENAGGKAVCCFFPVMLFVLCGLEHSVANMYYIPLGLLKKAPAAGGEGVTAAAYLLRNLLPVTLGNILGGGLLSAAYAAVYREAK